MRSCVYYVSHKITLLTGSVPDSSSIIFNRFTVSSSIFQSYFSSSLYSPLMRLIYLNVSVTRVRYKLGVNILRSIRLSSVDASRTSPHRTRSLETCSLPSLVPLPFFLLHVASVATTLWRRSGPALHSSCPVGETCIMLALSRMHDLHKERFDKSTTSGSMRWAFPNERTTCTPTHGRRNSTRSRRIVA